MVRHQQRMENPRHREHINASILNNYLKVAEVCKRLQKTKSYSSWPDSELEVMLEKVELEKVKLPQEIKIKVLE
eukprot:5714660-Amphidinium_carterae.1